MLAISDANDNDGEGHDACRLMPTGQSLTLYVECWTVQYVRIPYCMRVENCEFASTFQLSLPGFNAIT
jgi:hypothetical protein